MSPVLGLDPYLGLSGMSVKQKALVQNPETDTGPFGSHWGEKEQTVSTPVPLMTGTALSRNLGILAFEGNPASHV